MKKYNEALERAKRFMDVRGVKLSENALVVVKELIGTVFPELNESEDERIRKRLIEQMERWHECALENNVVQDIKDSADAITYLEKQKELPTNEEMLRTLRTEYEKGVADTIAEYEKKEQKPVECIEFDNEFKNQVSHLLASVLNKEWEYSKGFVEYTAQQLLGYAKHEVSPAEWSEEDEGMLETIIADYDYLSKTWLSDFENRVGATDLEARRDTREQISWLKSLRPQSKQEWSEEDKVKLNDVIRLIEDSGHVQSIREHYTTFLKTLPNRFSLNPSWKPSEEQMVVLLNAEGLVRANNYPKNAKILASLYEQLKKL